MTGGEQIKIGIADAGDHRLIAPEASDQMRRKGGAVQRLGRGSSIAHPDAPFICSPAPASA
jgi:hypothetical protein